MSDEINWYIFYTTIIFIPFILRWLMGNRSKNNVTPASSIKTIEIEEKDTIEVLIPKVCNYCGAEGNQTDRFCQYCGANLEK